MGDAEEWSKTKRCPASSGNGCMKRRLAAAVPPALTSVQEQEVVA